MIPAATVVLSVAKWPVAQHSALGFSPAIAPSIPLRFSAHAAAVGLMAEATRLRASKDEAIRICGAAALLCFSPAAWEVVLRETGYPKDALVAFAAHAAPWSIHRPGPDSVAQAIPRGQEPQLTLHAPAAGSSKTGEAAQHRHACDVVKL
jgi:hypothetical protein